MRLTHFEIKGFRSLYDVSLPMRPLMVLIGPNGAGKSTFLDAFRILRDSALQHLTEALSERGGLHSLLTRDKALQLAFGIDFASISPENTNTSELEYHYELAINAPNFWGYDILRERLTQRTADGKEGVFFDNSAGQALYWDAEKTKHLQWEIKNAREPMLSQHKQSFEAYVLTSALASISYNSWFDIGPRSPIRLPQDLAPGLSPMDNGERLFSALYNIRSQYPDYYEHIMEVLQVAFPSLARIELPLIATGKASLHWYDLHSQLPFDQMQLSDGTLRFLLLTTVLLAPLKPPIILIDEPEVSLHPSLLMILADLLREASIESQVIVSTHSDRLIRFLEPEDVAVIDKEDDISTISWLDADRLRSWLQDYTLDELWSMGELGGRP